MGRRIRPDNFYGNVSNCSFHAMITVNIYFDLNEKVVGWGEPRPRTFHLVGLGRTSWRPMYDIVAVFK